MFSAILTRLTPRSLRARLTFWYVLTLGATLSLFAVGVLSFRARAAFETLDAELAMRANRLGADLRQDLFSLDVEDALASDPRAASEPICVRAASGVTIFRSPAFPELTWSGEGEAMAAARERSGERTLQDRRGESVRMATVDIPRPGADRLVLQLTTAASTATQPLVELAAVLVATIGFVLAVAGFGSRFTVGRALAPVDSIVARVRDIQAQSLGERLDVRADSQELDRLVTTLNAMLDRIEASVSSARRFAADASHELQTPIASIRGTLDMGLRFGGTAAEWREHAVDLLDDVDRLSELVRDLRLIALAEAGHLLDEREIVPMAELVRDCCETAAAIADEQQVQVETSILDSRGGQRQQSSFAARRSEPAPECRPLLAGGRNGARVGRSRGSGRGRDRQRLRLRHRRRRSPPHLRAILPRGSGPSPRHRRQRAGAGHRRPDRPGARRPRRGVQRPGPRLHVLDRPASAA